MPLQHAEFRNATASGRGDVPRRVVVRPCAGCGRWYDQGQVYLTGHAQAAQGWQPVRKAGKCPKCENHEEGET